MLSPIYVALLHHSMLDKAGNTVTTSITNLDIHDISRAARTYGLAGYYLVNPEPEQQRIAKRIMQHWQKGGGISYNPKRAEAFEQTKIVAWLNEAISDIEKARNERPFVVMTTARSVNELEYMRFSTLRDRIADSTKPILLVLGTGWGIETSVLKMADAVLESIQAEVDSGYAHLSVRSAAAILFDRLLGARN